MLLKLDKNKLNIFLEKSRRRSFVGTLSYLEKKKKYVFEYDEQYRYGERPLSLSPEFSLFKKTHYSKELFDFFKDRIPLRENPAYEDYCRSQGISVEEKNPIVLLGTIGKRGPSSFIFEAVYSTEFSFSDIVEFRKEFKVSQDDFAKVFDIPLSTLQKIERGESKDKNILRLIEIYMTFPETALWQLEQTGGRVHHRSRSKLKSIFFKLLDCPSKLSI